MAWLAACAGLAGAGELFKYNRESYFFDRELYIKRAYQAQDMRLKQFELYREDVRELIELTVGKMENYLIVNTLQLGFTVCFFVEGRPDQKHHGPQWLIYLLIMCNMGAFLYFLLSIWLAIQASIAAHSFGVRMLTQFVRLPVPTKAQIDKAAVQSEAYETSSTKTMLRIPLWRQQLHRLDAAMGDTSTELAAAAAAARAAERGNQEPESFQDGPLSPVTMLEHVKLFRRLQANWQSYDAYARVCMGLGTNQLMHTFTYYGLGILVGGNYVPWPAFCCVILFTTCAWILARLDLYLSRRILAVAAALLVLPPLFTTISLCILRPQSHDLKRLAKLLLPCVYMLHIVWIAFTVCVARANDVGGVFLPRNFRSVLYLDVFGWLSEGEGGSDQEALQREASSTGRLPTALRSMIEHESRRLSAELREDLQRWESREVKVLVGDSDASTMQSLMQLRERFDAIMRDLPPSVLEADSVSVAESNQAVWLRLEHNAYDSPMEYFHCCETEETLWETPQGNVRISDLPTLEESLKLLAEQALTLKEGAPRRVEPESEPSGHHSGRRTLMEGANDDEGDQAFGGRESAPAERFLPGSFSFHPTAHGARTRPTSSVTAAAQEGDSAGRADAAANRGGVVFFHRPGELPWRTVLHGSFVLIGMWIIALVWCIMVVPRRIEEQIHAEKEAASHILRPERVVDSGWPHPFVRPSGMACHSRLETGADVAAKSGGTGVHVALLADKYGAYAIHLDYTVSPPTASVLPPTSMLSVAITRCIDQSPRLQGGGLLDISLECPEKAVLAAADRSASGNSGKGCAALLLATDGRAALRCPLGADGPASTRLVLRGDGWRAIAAVEGGHGHRIWAAGPRSVVLLEARDRDHPTELSPIREICEGSFCGTITQLHDLGGRLLLGLRTDGLLYAWSLTDQRKPRHWQLRAHAGVHWGGGLCTAWDVALTAPSPGASFDLAASSERPSTLSLWRAELPNNLFGSSNDGSDVGIGSLPAI